MTKRVQLQTATATANLQFIIANIQNNDVSGKTEPNVTQRVNSLYMS